LARHAAVQAAFCFDSISFLNGGWWGFAEGVGEHCGGRGVAGLNSRLVCRNRLVVAVPKKRKLYVDLVLLWPPKADIEPPFAWTANC
jgi:hypothetical protein